MVFLQKKSNIVHIIILIISLILAIICTCTFSHKKIGEICITVQETYNQESSNNQIRIKSVIGNNGRIYDLSMLADENGWEYDAESRDLGYYGGENRTIVLDCSEDSSINLRFQKQNSSGIIKIEGNNIRTTEVDLYDPQWVYADKTIAGKTNYLFCIVWFFLYFVIFELLYLGIKQCTKIKNVAIRFLFLFIGLEALFAIFFNIMYPKEVIALDIADTEHIRYKGLESVALGWFSTEEDPYIVVSLDKAIRVRSVQVTLNYMSEEDLWGQVFLLDSYEKDNLTFFSGDNKVVFPLHIGKKYMATGVRLDVVSKAGATVLPAYTTINSHRDILSVATQSAILIWMVILAIYLMVLAYFKFSSELKHKILLMGITLLNPVVVIWAIEHFDGTSLSLTKFALVATYFVMLSTEIILLAITRRIYVAVIVTDVVCTLIGLINYYVTVFKGVPFTFADILNFSTAMNVAENYEIVVSQYIFIGVLAVLAVIGVAIVYNVIYRKKLYCIKLYQRAIIIAVAVGVIVCIFKFGNIQDLTNTLAVSNKYEASGVVLGFFSSASGIKRPEGYSDDKAEQIMAEYQENSQKEMKTPNIIIIMNESFADLSILGEFETNQEVLPYFDSLSTNVIKGYCGVSVFGGGTCNSEYEALTGNSMAFFPSDSYTYNQFCAGNVNGIASYLGDLGYYCVAEHPASAGNYNRETVYSNMGFDELIFDDSFSNPETIRYTSDWSTYENILSKIAEVDEPLFMLDITMQNHGSYATHTRWDEPIELIDMDYPNTEEYLSSVHVSDMALQKLLENLETCEEPTYVLFFGDHLPSTGDGFIGDVLGQSGNPELLQYFTPFVIWSNVGMEEQLDVITSTNYLGQMLFDATGVPMPAYFSYLQEVSRQVPVITVNGYQDADGKWYDWQEPSDYSELLSEYSIVQYYNVKK